LAREVATRASVDCLAPDTALAGLVFWSARMAVRTWRPRGVITMYEGQGWESCARLGVKAAGRACTTIGYQHTVLLRGNLALLRRPDPAEESLRPEVVLCLGPRPRAILGPAHRRSTLLVFGTFRQMPQDAHRHPPRPTLRTVLVIPESGLIAEGKFLLEYAMRAARALPDHRFILRCHPIMPFERMRTHLEDDPRRLANIEVSTRISIVEDFLRSSAVLYRGSSAALYAMLYGLKPIYAHTEQLNARDPLGELSSWRESVSLIEELAQTLRQYAATDPDSAREAWEPAVAYARTYAVPVSDASLDRLLEATGCGA